MNDKHHNPGPKSPQKSPKKLHQSPQKSPNKLPQSPEKLADNKLTGSPIKKPHSPAKRKLEEAFSAAETTTDTENPAKKPKHSHFFVDPVAEIKKEFADNYKSKIIDACESLNEIARRLEEKEIALNSTRANIQRLIDVNEMMDKNIDVFDSILSKGLVSEISKQIQMMRDYCDFFVNTLDPFFKKVKKIQEDIFEYMQKIRAAAGCNLEDKNTYILAEEHTSEISKNAALLDLRLDELEIIHYQHVEFFKTVASYFDVQKVDESVTSFLQTENKILYEWTECWLEKIDFSDEVSDAKEFLAALDASVILAQNNQYQTLTLSPTS